MSRNAFCPTVIELNGEYEITAQLGCDEWKVNGTAITFEFFPACTYAAVKLRLKTL